MNFLKYISIKNKLLLNVIVPIVTIVVMAAIVLLGHVNQKEKYKEFDKL